MRTQEHVQSDYARLCSQAGDLNYRIKKLEKDLERIHIELYRLDSEYMDMTRTPPEDTHMEYPQTPEDTKTP
jgi:hypothetical protein